MNEFRKNLHVAYKKNIGNIIAKFLFDLAIDEKGFQEDPKLFIENWIDRNCLPMGDFSKEDAIREIEAWQK